MGDRVIAWSWNAVLILMIGVGTLTALAVIGLVAVVSANTFLPIVKDWFDIRDWAAFSGLATAAGAIATFTAAYVALCLGRSEARKKRESGMREAKLLELAAQEDLKALLPLVARIAVLIRGMDLHEQQYVPKERKGEVLDEIKGVVTRIELPSAEKMLDKATYLNGEKQVALIKIYSSIPALCRRVQKLKELDELTKVNSAKKVDGGLQIRSDIGRIAYYAKNFLPDQSRYYWRSLVYWGSNYDPEEESFHDHPVRR